MYNCILLYVAMSSHVHLWMMCVLGVNAGRARNRTSTWRKAKICPVPDCGHRNTHPRRHMAQCHRDLPASEVARLLASLRRQPVCPRPQDNIQPAMSADEPRSSTSASTVDVCRHILLRNVRLSVCLCVCLCVCQSVCVYKCVCLALCIFGSMSCVP